MDGDRMTDDAAADLPDLSGEAGAATPAAEAGNGDGAAGGGVGRAARLSADDRQPLTVRSDDVDLEDTEAWRIASTVRFVEARRLAELKRAQGYRCAVCASPFDPGSAALTLLEFPTTGVVPAAAHGECRMELASTPDWRYLLESLRAQGRGDEELRDLVDVLQGIEAAARAADRDAAELARLRRVWGPVETFVASALGPDGDLSDLQRVGANGAAAQAVARLVEDLAAAKRTAPAPREAAD